jgi:aspartate oxidase
MGLKGIQTDVLVIGSGAAGVMAALKAARMGCRVVLTSKVSMRSGNSALANGGWLVPSKDFPPDEYVNLVMEAGKKINDVKLVRILAQRGEAMIRALRETGVPLERRGERYWSIEIGTSTRIPGILLMDALLANIKDERVMPLPWLSIIELSLDGGRVSGAIGTMQNPLYWPRGGEAVSTGAMTITGGFWGMGIGSRCGRDCPYGIWSLSSVIPSLWPKPIYHP